MHRRKCGWVLQKCRAGTTVHPEGLSKGELINMSEKDVKMMIKISYGKKHRQRIHIQGILGDSSWLWKYQGDILEGEPNLGMWRLTKTKKSYSVYYIYATLWSGRKASTVQPIAEDRLQWNGFVLSLTQLFLTPWTAAHQAPLCMGFSRQEYWSGLPFPAPGDLPDLGIESKSSASTTLVGRFFYHS